jgi:hypothetical protein
VNVIVRHLERNIDQYAGEETATSQEDVEGVNPFDFFLYLCVVSMDDMKSYASSNPLEPYNVPHNWWVLIVAIHMSCYTRIPYQQMHKSKTLLYTVQIFW